MFRRPLTWLRNVLGSEVLQLTHATVLSRWLLNYGTDLTTVSQSSALIFAPHQDDETFGCGGLIALKRQQNATVSVVFLTDGGADQQDSLIVQTRHQEAMRALSILGVKTDHIHFLDYPDGQLNQFIHRQSAIAALAQLLVCYQPIEVYVPHCKDHHPDHEATYALVNEAITQSQVQVQLIQYAIWALWKSPFLLKLKPQDLANAYRISIHAVQDQKHHAITTYQSQIAILPPQFLQQFNQPFEVFFKVSPPKL